MEDDVFYYEYLGQHALSSSAIKQMLKAGTWDYKPVEETAALRDGRLSHILTLEPHRLKEITIVGGSKASRLYKDLKSLGSIVQNLYTLSEFNRCSKWAEAVNQDFEAFDYLHNSLKEVPEIKLIDGIPVRGKADILRPGEFIADFKTTRDIYNTDATIDAFGYDVQGALYRTLFDVDRFVIIWLDKNTLEVKCEDVPTRKLDEGRRKYLKAINLYKKQL